MSFTSVLYQSLIKTYKLFPYKKGICLLIRFFKIPNRKFYQDFKFKGKFKVKINNKSFQLISNNSTIENEIFWKGLDKGWENETMWLWKYLSSISKTIFDIGANAGVYSLISKTIDSIADIYAFEPVKRTFANLQNNLLANNYKINAFQVALSDKSGKQIIFDVKDEIQYSASLNPMMLKGRYNPPLNIIEYEVETITIDEFLQKHNIKKIDLIKLDVEMHEPEVLKGYKQIKNHKPFIIIEVLTENIANQLNDLFINSDYIIYHLPQYKKLDKKSKFEAIVDKFNYLLCPKEKEYLLENIV